MKNSIFLDTCIFFEIHENRGIYQSLIHLKNRGYTLSSSLTVIGELIQQLAPREEKNEYLNTFWSFIEEVDLILLIPNSGVSYACYLICKYTDDGRMKAEYTDLFIWRMQRHTKFPSLSQPTSICLISVSLDTSLTRGSNKQR